MKYAKNGARRTSLRLISQPVIGKRGGDGFLGAGPAKNKFCTDMLGLLTLSPTALGPIGPRVFKGIQLKA